MSRVGRKPVVVPQGVKVELKKNDFVVQGPKGSLNISIHPRMKVTIENNEVLVERSTNIGNDRALHGLTRSLIQNMIIGVTEGFSKELDIIGIGVKAQVSGKVLTMNLGYTHPIVYQIPDNVDVKCSNPTHLVVSGIDKQAVGQVAAEIRAFYKPEPYKGKGIRYVGEHVRRKQGKTVG